MAAEEGGKHEGYLRTNDKVSSSKFISFSFVPTSSEPYKAYTFDLCFFDRSAS